MVANAGSLEELASTADDIAKLLAMTLTRDCETRSEAYLMLNDVGFEPARIAELLGEKYNSVYRSLKRAGRFD